MFDVGDFVYLSRTVIKPASGDHPEFLMGIRGEKVKILKFVEGREYQWLIEGSTNKGKSWWTKGNDLLMTKPWSDC